MREIRSEQAANQALQPLSKAEQPKWMQPAPKRAEKLSTLTKVAKLLKLV